MSSRSASRAGAGRRGRQRLDERVLAEGLAATRSEARGLILAGRILVDDVPQTKAGFAVAAEAPLRRRGGARPYVSRGGEKLSAALDVFAVDPAGRICLDVGASTGGFTDCLLQRGAVRVIAVDVGRGQLHPRLRGDSRVRALESTHARYLRRESLGEAIGLLTADVSFISLRQLLPPLKAVAPEAEAVVLVKPQFEVGRGQVGKGGVVRDDALRVGAADAVARCAGDVGWEEAGRVESALPGPKGNREIFLWLRPRPPGPPRADARPLTVALGGYV